jgi:hypothetical protein
LWFAHGQSLSQSDLREMKTSLTPQWMDEKEEREVAPN